MAGTEKPIEDRSQKPTLRRTLVIGGGVILSVIIALTVGLGVGLTRSRSNDNMQALAPPQASPMSNTSVPKNIWKPTAGISWQIELLSSLNSTSTDAFSVWDIDLFDNNATVIAGLQANGAKLICYFSAGSYENWRPDTSEFNASDLGKNLDGWPGERWLNISSQNVRKIMLARLDLAVEKGCNGVDPDNVDGYDNDNGLGLTTADSIDYLEFLADAAHQRSLSIGLKNAGEVLPDVIDIMQWSVNEQCVQYEECDVFSPFIRQGKPVFHVEYPKGESVSNDDEVPEQEVKTICGDRQATGFSTIMKNIALDDWVESCPD